MDGVLSALRKLLHAAGGRRPVEAAAGGRLLCLALAVAP
jgi:hypothetical protein